jgi:DNA (cytosine-5)-methyltransferase 1
MIAGAAYYNEFDKGKAAWLKELMRRGVIQEGEIDTRSIRDVRPNDLRGFIRCHFFAGIGVWDYALQQAAWPEGEEVWTASCPCQPFSAAGRRKAKADERHLWPALAPLIAARRPKRILGEQVASLDGLAWFDDVHADLGNYGYTIGAAITPACGYGAPHRRERLYFVAVTNGSAERREWWRSGKESDTRWNEPESKRLRNADGAMGDASEPGLEERGAERRDDGAECETAQRAGSSDGSVGVTESRGRRKRRDETRSRSSGYFNGKSNIDSLEHSERSERWPDTQPGGRQSAGQDGQRQAASGTGERGPVNGFWADAEWLYCKDQKYRAAKPGTFPLAHGATRRVLRLRGYGDAIVSPQAIAWVRAVMSIWRSTQ